MHFVTVSVVRLLPTAKPFLFSEQVPGCKAKQGKAEKTLQMWDTRDSWAGCHESALGCRLVSDKAGRFPTICVGLALCGASCMLLGPLPWLQLPPAGHASMWAAMGLLGAASALVGVGFRVC